MEIEVDIKEVKEFILSDSFKDFLMSNTTDFAIAAFILQTLLNKIDEIEGMK